MSDGINVVELVKEVSQRRRGKACVVLTHDIAEQKIWADELATQCESDHVNLLEYFANHPDLADSVSQTNLDKFFDMLPLLSQKDILVVSGIEFLWASWAGQVNIVDSFTSRVQWWAQRPAIVIVMQYDKAIAKSEFKRFKGKTFIIDQKDTYVLK